jgi:hypothetical protein
MGRPAPFLLITLVGGLAGCGGSSAVPGPPAKPANGPSAETITADRLDLDSPRSVLGYWKGFKPTGDGGAPDEQWKGHRSKVEGKPVRWVATFSQLTPDGRAEVLDQVAWPNPIYKDWSERPEEDPRDIYLLRPVPSWGGEGKPRGFPVADPAWAGTLKRGAAVVIVGTLETIHDDPAKPDPIKLSGERQKKAHPCVAVIPDGVVQKP